MSAASRARFAEVVRSEPVDVGLAALLIATEVEPTLDVDASLALLDTLAAGARDHVIAHGPAQGLLLGLQGFSGDELDFEDLRASLLPEVLRRGRGLPLLLSIVWVEVAARLDVVASYAEVPGRVVVLLGDLEDEHVVVDAFARAVVRDRVRALSAHEVLLRLLTNIRALSVRQPRSLGSARLRLWATELSLLLPSHPMELRRERGELLVRLGSYAHGAEELEFYAAVVQDADEPAADACRRQARQARARLN